MQRLLQLARGIDRLSEWTGRAVYWLVLLTVLIGAYNALVRRVAPTFSSNTYLELQWYLFSIVFLLGAAYTLRHDAHVRVDVFYGRLSRRGKAWVNVLGTLFFLLPFCALMLWTSWPAVMNSWAVREASPDPGGLPRYPIKTVLLVAFVLLALQGLSMLIKEIAVLRGATDDPGLLSDE